MEPFSISCTTCRARLRVRDVSAVGQILTCPKCGSMVLVEAPPAGSTGSTGASAGGGPGPRGPAVPDSMPHGPPPRPASLPPDQTRVADTVDDPTHYGTVRTPAAPSEAAEPSDIEFRADEGELAASPGTAAPSPWNELPDPAWQSENGRRRRRWLLVGVATATRAALSIAAFVFLVGRAPVRVAEQDSATTADPPARVNGAGGGPTVLESPPADSKGTATTEGADGAAVPPSMDLPEASPPLRAPTEPPRDSPAEPAASRTPAPPTPPDPGLPAANGESVRPPEAPKESAAAVPPDLVPPRPDAATKADRMTPGGGLAETLRKLGGFLDETEAVDRATTPVPPATDSPAAAPTADGSPEMPVPVAEPAPRPRPAPREVDLAARLADPVQQIQASLPLQDFLSFVTTYSTIPITLDPDVLVWLKLTPDSPVEVQLESTTVEALLENVLPKLGLQAIPVDNHLLVTRGTVGDGGLRTARRPVVDLITEDPAQSERLLEWIQSLISPETWAASGGEGTLSITDGWLELRQRDSIVLEVSAFLERLRVARGLPKKSPFDDRLFQPVTRTARAAPRLSRHVTIHYPRPTSFQRIVRRLAKESSTALLINWQSLERAGWNPNAESTLSASDLTLADALTALLGPMDLGYRIVDETTFQIMALEDLEARREVELYPVAPLLMEGSDAAGLQQRLRESLPPGWFDGGEGVLRLDTNSRCLLILASQPRHQALEKQLHSWMPTGK